MAIRRQACDQRNRRSPVPPRGVSALLFGLVLAATAPAQAPEAPRYLQYLGPSGARPFLRDGWGVLDFTLTNAAAKDLEARLLTFFADTPDRQYGRDVWVPARAARSSWFCIGPPQLAPQHNPAELKALLYDRTGGQERLLRPPAGSVLHAELARYQPRESGTTLLLDTELAVAAQEPVSPREQARAAEAQELVRVFRFQQGLSLQVNVMRQRYLPPVPEGFDGLAQVVLGSDHLIDDAAGRRALRAWLERGGTVWVMLDRVQPATGAALLGDAVDLQVVDRTGLNHIQIGNGPVNAHRAETLALDVEEPVDFVRAVAPGASVLYTVGGWPAAFVMEVGRGRVLFTTLGPRGWMRPRTKKDPVPLDREYPHTWVAEMPLQFVASELQRRPERPPLAPDDVRAYLIDQIGYAVVSRTTVLAILGLFLLTLIAAFVALSRYGLQQHLGWLGPALALSAAGLVAAVGASAHRAVPPTVAMLQLIDAVPGLEEAQATGALAIYQPAASTLSCGAERGGAFDLDQTGQRGRVQPRLQLDLDRWRWERLNLPAGVREGPFHYTLSSREPLEATVRFGPNGVEGRLNAGPCRQLEDALLSTPDQPPLAVHLAADGSFHAGSADTLPAGQFTVGGLLSDPQRRRQTLYEKLLAEPRPRYLAQHGMLLAWAAPLDMDFALLPEARHAGSALLLAPLRFERTPPRTPVTIPATFVACRRVTEDGHSHRPVVTARTGAHVRLRFQVPECVRPLAVERARLTLHLFAPLREVHVGSNTERWHRLTSPVGVEQIDITDPRRLPVDEQGAVNLNVDVEELRVRNVAQDEWRLEAAGLEIRGRTLASKGERDAR